MIHISLLIFDLFLTSITASKFWEGFFSYTFATPYCSLTYNFNPLQSAYRKHPSTETSLIHLLDSIYHAADNGLATILLSLPLDLSLLTLAFDSIDHDILLNRLTSSLASWVLPTIGSSLISLTGYF